MPTVFADAIDAIEDPSAADDEETRLLASITALAVTIADFYLNDGDADDLRNITTQATANGLSGDALDRVLDGVQANASEIAAQLNLSISAVEYSATIARARSQLVEQVLQTDEMWHQERQRREELERTQATYEAEARIDPLTGLGNRRAFDEQLAMHLQIRLEAKTKLHKPMGIVMIDLDHFKSVNDTYGHDVGDEVLRKLAAAVTPITRDEETIARYGGEEFVLFAPAATVEELTKAGERLRASIEAIQLPLSNGETLRVTASFGIATLWQPVSEQDGAKLLKAADEALYEAKESGRNRVVVSAVDLG
jgi:diguanylate cyclase (GGDEF)-like protein